MHRNVPSCNAGFNRLEASIAPPDVAPTNATDSRGRKLFSSMACVFVVAAAGPAMPDVRAEPYNGAVCMWKRVDGIGENYFLDFNPE